MSMYVCMYVMKNRPNSEEAPHGNVNFEGRRNVIFRTLRTGARCTSKLSGRSARQRDFRQNFSRRPARMHDSSQKCSRRSSRERDFGQKRTILSGSVWYRIGIEIVP